MKRFLLLVAVAAALLALPGCGKKSSPTRPSCNRMLLSGELVARTHNVIKIKVLFDDGTVAPGSFVLEASFQTGVWSPLTATDPGGDTFVLDLAPDGSTRTYALRAWVGGCVTQNDVTVPVPF